jgi:hypothetical protein
MKAERALLASYNSSAMTGSEPSIALQVRAARPAPATAACVRAELYEVLRSACRGIGRGAAARTAHLQAGEGSVVRRGGLRGAALTRACNLVQVLVGDGGERSQRALRYVQYLRFKPAGRRQAASQIVPVGYQARVRHRRRLGVAIERSAQLARRWRARWHVACWAGTQRG